MMKRVLARRLILLAVFPGCYLLAVSGGGYALGGWLALGVAASVLVRWPAGSLLVLAWGIGGWVVMEVFGSVHWVFEGVTQMVLMLAMFVVLLVPAFILWMLGWDGLY